MGCICVKAMHPILFFMKILFRKILEYDLKKNQKNSYIHAYKVLSQEVNPDSLQKEKFIPKSRIVFCSKLIRAKQCLKKDKNLKIIFTKSLNEIPFKIKIYLKKIDYEKLGSVSVRKIFKKLFIEDKLMISRNQIFIEIKKFIEDLKNNYNSEKSITIISHSFRLKCIEAYLKTEGKIINNPKLIEKYIKDDKKTFDFGEGFDFEI